MGVEGLESDSAIYINRNDEQKHLTGFRGGIANKHIKAQCIGHDL